MKATEFVKKYGLEESAKITSESVEFGKNVFYDLSDELYYGSDFGGRICVNELKQIVEAFELVECNIGYKFNKSAVLKILDIPDSELTLIQIEFKKAINLVEKCQND